MARIRAALSIDGLLVFIFAAFVVVNFFIFLVVILYTHNPLLYTILYTTLH